MQGHITESPSHFKPAPHGRVVSLCMNIPGQAHTTRKSSLTINGHITESCQVKPTTHGHLVSLWTDTSHSHHIQVHGIQTSSFTLNGHITQSSCHVKPTPHGQDVSLCMDTPPSHHIQAHNIQTSILNINGHITQSPCHVKPTPHGQQVSLWMNTSPSFHVRSSPQHMDKKSHCEWTHHTVIISVQAHNTQTSSLTIHGHTVQASGSSPQHTDK